MRPKAADRPFPSGEASESLRESTATRRPIVRAAALMGDAFCDHEGGTSAMRIMAFLVCVVVLGAWLWGMAEAGHYIPLGWAEAGLVGGACGAKAAQSRFELGSGGLWGAHGYDSGLSDVIAPAPDRTATAPAPRDMEIGGL